MGRELCESAPTHKWSIYIKTLQCSDEVTLTVGIVRINDNRMYTYTQLGRTSLYHDKSLNLLGGIAPFPFFMLPL